MASQCFHVAGTFRNIFCNVFHFFSTYNSCWGVFQRDFILSVPQGSVLTGFYGCRRQFPLLARRLDLTPAFFRTHPIKPIIPGSLAGGVDEYWSDDDLGIEDDDEFRKKKAVHDKKKRQAEKVHTISFREQEHCSQRTTWICRYLFAWYLRSSGKELGVQYCTS